MNIREIAKGYNASNLLLWLLKIPYATLKRHNYINTYLIDDNKPYEDSLYVLFKPPVIYDFNQFIQAEGKRTHLLIDDYDCGKYIVLVYKLPSEFKNDYAKFYEGKYSEFSVKFKDMIPMYLASPNTHKQDSNLAWLIVNRSQVLRNKWKEVICDVGEDIVGEVWPIVNLEKENLSYYDTCSKSSPETTG